jgi:hypothetical protein
MDLSVIQVQLASVLRAIDQELTKLMPSVAVPSVTSSAHDQLCRKMSSWESQLDLMARNLSSELQRLQLESKRISSFPRSARYAMAQSVTDRIRNFDGAMSAAATVRDRLEQLFDRLGRPTGPEIVKAIEELTTGAYKQIELTQAAVRELRSLTTKSSGPVIRGATPAAVPDLIVSIAVVGRLLHLLALRLMGGSRRAAGPPDR